jgi:GNAT superfamily N-acetyltransferase
VLRIAKLDRAHDVSAFDCGVEALNIYLQRYARQNQKAEAAQTYLGLMDESIIGYYTLVASHVEFDDAPQRLRKGLARHPVPTMLLARLAVQAGLQGRGIGKGLLRDATLRTLQVADIAGTRALVVHAKDEAAFQFYKQFGFESGFDQPMHLYMLTSDIRRSMLAN